jgi:4-carboxymuconolactone decarboxylase
VAALVSLYRTDQLGSHLQRALANGLTKDELVQAITHLALYAGWPNAMTAITQLKKITEDLQRPLTAARRAPEDSQKPRRP